MTQLSAARAGKITDEMKIAAKLENMPAELMRQQIENGKIVIPANIHRGNRSLCAIGMGCRTKVNANLGNSGDFPDIETELKKLRAAQEAKTDTIMDLSTGGDIDEVRAILLKEATVTFGTVPIYQATITAIKNKGALKELTGDDMIAAIRKHAEDGVDFVTVHCGVTLETLRHFRNQGRLCDIVSRGGMFLATWMLFHEKENPLYERYDEVLQICHEHDVTLSLGDGFRPGALVDSFDRAQVSELLTLAELAERARKADVQVMIEGPGHVPLNQIAAQIQMQKELCKGAPFYVLGPIVTDIAPGYDHITSAIGGALAASVGADFLCYVTPAEHLRLPTEEDVRTGVIVSRIAAHAADVAKGIPGAIEQDIEMSRQRKLGDWEKQIELSIDPERAREYRQSGNPKNERECSMCGEYCVYKISEGLKDIFGKEQ